MTENEKTELFDKWYDENYDEWAEGEEGIALREELEQAFKGGIAELENKIADIKANCDLAIEGRDIKIKELEQKLEQTEKDLTDYQFNYPKIKELSKENAELKEKLKPENCLKLLAKEGYIKFTSEQLTEAKDLIKNIIRVTWGEGWNYSLDWKVKAEQFLNSVVEK